ncbi:MAG: hypothetical protein ACRDTH_01790 [Pseudonocardiaceae bacterium]
MPTRPRSQGTERVVGVGVRDARFGECVACDVLLYRVAVDVHLARGDAGAAEQAWRRLEEPTTVATSRPGLRSPTNAVIAALAG